MTTNSKARALALASFMGAAVLAGCGGGGGGGGGGSSTNDNTNTVTAKAVTAPVSFNHPVGSPLLTTDTLTVTFSEAMNTATATMTPAGGTWNAAGTTYTFPTLTTGVLDVAIYADSASGTSRLSLSDILFNVYDPNSTPFVYVSKAGNDSTGAGTIAAPYATIAKAMSTATAGQAVLVAAGTYSVDSGAGTNIAMTNGVSLYGGYASDFASRDPAANVTTITDTTATAAASLITTDYGTDSDTSGNMAEGAPMAAITVGSLSDGQAMIIDGFTINGSSSAATVNSAAVSINDGGVGSVYSIVLSHDTINGGAGSAMSVGVYAPVVSTYMLVEDSIDGGTSAGMSVGTYTADGTLLAAYSVLKGGSGVVNAAVFNDDLSDVYSTIRWSQISGGSGTNSYGVYSVPNSPAYTYPVLVGNSISGGTGSTVSTAVFITSWVSANILNNTIDGGSGHDSAGVVTVNSDSSDIYANTISGGSGATSSTAIYNSAGATVQVLNNILLAAGNGTRVCYNNVDGFDVSSTDEMFENNVLSPSCTTALYSYAGTGVTKTTDSTIIGQAPNTLADKGNVSVDPGFASATDWHLTAASPLEVRQGGQDVTTLKIFGDLTGGTDMDSNVRTASTTTATNIGAAGLSMGAYEKD